MLAGFGDTVAASLLRLLGSSEIAIGAAIQSVGH